MTVYIDLPQKQHCHFHPIQKLSFNSDGIPQLIIYS